MNIEATVNSLWHSNSMSCSETAITRKWIIIWIYKHINSKNNFYKFYYYGIMHLS